MRLIDADELNTHFNNYMNSVLRNDREDTIGKLFVIRTSEVVRDCMKIVDMEETQDVRPKGKWIEECETVGGHYHLMLSCTACGWTTDRLSTRENYCPNCGADMRGGD